MKTSYLLLSIIFSINTTVLGQFSFIAIQDTIVLTDSNSVVFHSQDIDTNNYYCTGFFNGFQLTIIDSMFEDLTTISKAIEKENRIRNVEIEKKIGKHMLIQENPFHKYAFQIYPVKNQEGKMFYLTIILKKSKFKDWKLKPVFINDGCNYYYIYGLVPI